MPPSCAPHAVEHEYFWNTFGNSTTPTTGRYTDEEAEVTEIGVAGNVSAGLTRMELFEA